MNTAEAHALNQVTLSLYREGRELQLHNFQDWALEQVRSLIPFDSAWWGNAASDPAKIHWLHLYNCDASIMDAYTPVMAQDFFRAALLAQPGVSINLSDLTTRARFVRTKLYRQIGKRYHIAWSLGTLLNDPVSSLSEFLTLHRHDPKRPFSEAERQTKELLTPHLVEAFRAVRLRHFLKDKDSRINAWSLVDDQGYIREISPAFSACLRAVWPHFQGNRLPDPLARCVIEGRPYKTESLGIGVRRCESWRFLVVTEKSVLDRLTPRERAIVDRYADGETYAAIALRLARSPATVRNHISHCFKKLGVHNKAELAKLFSDKKRAVHATV